MYDFEEVLVYVLFGCGMVLVTILERYRRGCGGKPRFRHGFIEDQK